MTDWVTARANCSPAVMFERLRQMAEANTQKRNEQLRGERFVFMESEDTDVRKTRFTVFDQGTHKRVQFDLKGQVIVASDRQGNVLAEAALTLTDEGECRFRVGTNELESWQLLRRTLEPLFF